jgi:glycosyl transferase family 25
MKDLTDVNIYYINLDKRSDRRLQFESQPALSAMPPVQRIVAVHGLSLDTRYDKRIGVHTRVQVITEHRRSHYEIHSRGALGASFSHLKVWQTFLDSDAKYALILEDDVDLPPTFAMMVRDSAKNLPSEWGIWTLGWWGKSRNPKLTKDIPKSTFKNVIHFVGAHCYIITRKAAEILVKESLPIETHIEHFMSNIAFLHKFSIVRDPMLHLTQSPTISDIRKPKGCSTCNINRDDGIGKRLANM